MRNAKEIMELRKKMIEDFEVERRNIDGQWNLIEGLVDNAKITKDTKYIALGKIGNLYSENIKRLIELGYIIDESKSCTNLYFSNEDYHNNVSKHDLNKVSDKPERNIPSYRNKRLPGKNKLEEIPFRPEGMSDDDLQEIFDTFMGVFKDTGK